MKTPLIILLALCSLAFAQNKQTVAIYMTGEEPIEALGSHRMMGRALVNAIEKTNNYIAVDRTDAIQQSRAVNDAQIKAWGSRNRVQFICMVEINAVRSGGFNLNARFMGVETTILTRSSTTANNLRDGNEMMRVAQHIIHELISKVEHSRERIAREQAESAQQASRSSVAAIARTHTNSDVNVRSTPTSDNNDNVIEPIVRNTPVEILERHHDGWVHIRYGNGKEGYVARRFLAGEPTSPAHRQSLVSTYTLTINFTQGGTVTRNPSQQTYTAGTKVAITANPASGYRFERWVEYPTLGSNAGITATMNNNFTLTPVFTRITPPSPPIAGYTLTVNQAPGGRVSRHPDRTNYAAGTVVVLTATPAHGYTFRYWIGASTSTVKTITLTMNSNMTVTPVFAINNSTPPPPVRPSVRSSQAQPQHPYDSWGLRTGFALRSVADPDHAFVAIPEVYMRFKLNPSGDHRLYTGIGWSNGGGSIKMDGSDMDVTFKGNEFHIAGFFEWYGESPTKNIYAYGGPGMMLNYHNYRYNSPTIGSSFTGFGLDIGVQGGIEGRVGAFLWDINARPMIYIRFWDTEKIPVGVIGTIGVSLGYAF